MLDFKREIFNFAEQRVILTSWRDSSNQSWRALAPFYLEKVHDWGGVQGETREQAIQYLKHRLQRYITVQMTKEVSKKGLLEETTGHI
ncbi:MAG: hypothetical protein EOP04_10630 [Proteobacteria bacterium]|nr:MAG: hypothetical protein EOP04_10630 [Pseudomonadota bacterium]